MATSTQMTVEQIEALLEESGVARKAFWSEMGVDPMPLPRSSVEDVVAALADAE